MANFNTHFLVGTIVTGMGATICYATGLCGLSLSLGLWATGVMGSLMPDIDSDNSFVLGLFFNVIAFVLMALSMFWLSAQLSIIELWLALGFIYGVVRFPLMYSFQKFSRHRGVFHSILAAVLFGLLQVQLCYWGLGVSAENAWLLGLFMSAGYLIHLILDECYSVDLLNVKIKRSFGTALKLFSVQYLGRSAVMAVAVVVLFLATPPIATSWSTMNSAAYSSLFEWRLNSATMQGLVQRLFSSIQN